MTRTFNRRRQVTATERIASELEDISETLRRIAFYHKVYEDRQKFLSDVLAGFVPMLQKYVTDTLDPKHPFELPTFPANPRFRRRKSPRPKKEAAA